MDALSGIQLRDRAALVGETLVIADLHLGMTAAANLDAPVGAETDIVDRVAALCDRYTPETVVIAGDVLHSFESVPPLVEENFASLQEAVENAGSDLLATPGNHDTMLDAIWDGQMIDEYHIGDTIVCHGHTEPAAEADRYLVGHDHPTITIEGHTRPCYLAGDSVFQNADLLMLPSFNRLVSGVEINTMNGEDFMTPLVTSTDSLAPVVRDEERDETLTFPALGAFRHKL